MAQVIASTVFTAIVLFSTIAQSAQQLAEAKPADVPGIVTAKPADGLFVELPDGRFMVPYSDAVPGTDIKFEMVPIPGGKFLMGSPDDEEDRREDEGPQVELTVAPFWMGKHEVTWGEYRYFMRLDQAFKQFKHDKVRPVNDTNRIDAIAAPSSLYDPSFTFDAGKGNNQPAATPTQFAAKQYTKLVSLLLGEFYRLPTESEWEYACRAGTTTRFYFGDDAEQLEFHAWYALNSDDERHTVGELPANPWGLHDMYGNVSEWVLDSYNEEGYADLAKVKDLQGDFYRKSEDAYPRVLRGGSWELEVEDCRSASRMPSDDEGWKIQDPNFPKSPWWYTDSPATGVGFRIIRPLDAPADREAKESFWQADSVEVAEDVAQRLEHEGKGALGVVDPTLPKVIDGGGK